MKISKLSGSVSSHSDLPLSPSVTGEELQRAWDKGTVTIKEYLNDVLSVELDVKFEEVCGQLSSLSDESFEMSEHKSNTIHSESGVHNIRYKDSKLEICVDGEWNVVIDNENPLELAKGGTGVRDIVSLKRLLGIDSAKKEVIWQGKLLGGHSVQILNINDYDEVRVFYVCTEGADVLRKNFVVDIKSFDLDDSYTDFTFIYPYTPSQLMYCCEVGVNGNEFECLNFAKRFVATTTTTSKNNNEGFYIYKITGTKY